MRSACPGEGRTNATFDPYSSPCTYMIDVGGTKRFEFGRAPRKSLGSGYALQVLPAVRAFRFYPSRKIRTDHNSRGEQVQGDEVGVRLEDHGTSYSIFNGAPTTFIP